MVIVGIDAHKRSHTAVAVDASGRRLGQRTIGTTSEDHLALLGWAEQFGPQRSWAIEDCPICLDDSKPICSRLASRSCGCRPS